MSQLFNVMNQTARTANGDLTNHSSLNPCVDLFFAAGSSRGQDISVKFMNAYHSDSDIALRILLWMRDIRGGAGERQQFKNILKTLIANDLVDERLFKVIPEIGRWDDLEVFFGTKFENLAALTWTTAIQSGNGLAAKWAPRKDSKGAKPLRKAIGLNERDWRKLVVANTNVVETQMCNREWDNINFNHVPSQAMSKYMTAFHKNSQSYVKWKEALVKGDPSVKVNAGAVYPYDILRKLPLTGSYNNQRHTSDPVLQKMWESLPDYLNGSDERLMPVIDVSGSMTSLIPKQQASCMDVAISLGIYIAERNSGHFKNMCMSFSEKPRMIKLNGDLANKTNTIKSKENVGYSTDLRALFSTMLNQAKHFHVPPEEMPNKFFIISDMEFNGSCITGSNDQTTYDSIKQMYMQSGYEMPKIIFWRVNTITKDNVPVTVNSQGTALVSGFSPSILTSLLGGNLTPENVMLSAVMIDRYKL